MFKLIRLILLIFIAFIVGLFFERNQVGERCLAAGGTMDRGLCRGASQ